MADIFISYSREDREWVSKLADALQAEGYSVWWDWDLLVGKRYRETIETELQVCKATVVVWSQHSIRSDFVRDEAEEGQQRNILVPILKELVRPPAGFRQLQTADFTTWTGGTTHAEYQRMIKGLSHLIGRDGSSAAPHVDAAPAPLAPPEPVHPAPVAEPAAAPVAEPAAAPVVPPTATQPAPAVQAKAPEPAPAHTSVLGTSPLPMTAPKKPMPVIGMIAIGAVALIALIVVGMFVAAQFTPAPKPVPPVAGGPAPTHGTPAAAGPAHPATPTPPPSGAADNGGATDAGGDEAGNSSPSSHGGSTDTAPPAPPSPPSGGDNGDTGQDVGQSH